MTMTMTIQINYDFLFQACSVSSREASEARSLPQDTDRRREGLSKGNFLGVKLL